MNLRASFSHALHSIIDWVTGSERFVVDEAKILEENGKDFVAGLQSKSMPQSLRRLDEFKIAAGVSALGAEVAELGPFALVLSAPAAIVPTCEGVKDFIDYGHRDRMRAHDIAAYLH